MNIEKIKKIVRLGESEQVEFKKSTGVLIAAFETVCAFLNGKGGTLLIGVTDGGKIIGQDVSDHSKQEIASHIAKIEPPAQSLIEIEYVSIENGKQVIVITVSAGNHIPYVYDGRAFYRNQSTTWRMQQHRYEQLIVERGQLNHSWDELVVNSRNSYSLNHKLVLSIVNEAINNRALPASAAKEDTLKILERFKLVKENQIFNAAIALFGENLFPDYPQCQIKLARFKGINKREFMDSKQLYGNIFELLEQGELFIKRHLPVAAKVVPEQLRRIETPIVPFDAVREALLNAFCHRDYSVRGGSVNIAIYDDRMELYSHGGLPPGVTIEKIKHGFSKPRNYLIAEVLHKCGYIETWGRGIQNIIELCKEANIPEPQFLADDLEFKVLFKFFYNIGSEIMNNELLVRKNLTSRQIEILENIEKFNELSFSEIKRHLKNSFSERTLHRELIALKNFGIIGNKGHTRNSVWFVLKGK